MKRILLCGILFLAVLLVGCGGKNTDFLAPFGTSYVAEVTGTLCGIDFSATVERGEATEGVCVPTTVTFYAPSALSGTTLTRAADGSVTVKSGGLAVGDMGGIGASLFDLFPISGAISHTEVTSEGHTRLTVGNATVELLADGTPYSVKTADVSAVVVNWKGEK